MLRTSLKRARSWPWRGRGVGLWGLRAYPFSPDNVFLGLIRDAPRVLSVLAYGYATLWFTTPFLVASLLLSLVAIVVYRRAPRRAPAAAALPAARERATPSLVLGETHSSTTPGPAARPEWLTIPQRASTPASWCSAPSAPARRPPACIRTSTSCFAGRQTTRPKVGGLVLEVKGDFCGQVRAMLQRAGRADDYIEIGLDTGVCYNPLHNELDPYAVAYAIATLLNNLFGRSKEPFWQQAYTDLLKFVILLRRISDGYTTFSEVYRYILDDAQIDHDIRRLKADLLGPAGRARHPSGRLPGALRPEPWATGSPRTPTTWRTRTRPPSRRSWRRGVPYEVRKPRGRLGGRKHQLEAVERWYCTAGAGSMRASARPSSKASSCSCRCSTTTPPCIARSVRREAPTCDDPPPGATAAAAARSAAGERAVLALNFPVGMNPGLARILGVMLKLDFQRAILQRIPQIAANPTASGATCSSSATSTTPSPPSVRRTRPATSAPSRCRGRPG